MKQNHSKENSFNHGKVLLIGSGKGGVGKSTVAVNLAVAMAQHGLKVALLDADVYGPSIPIMLGLRNVSPRIELSNGMEKVVPLSKFGIQIISLGFFVQEAHSIIWRGPMLHGALQKMIEGVMWGETDFLIVDLPPGTGDVLLSLSQLLKVDGGIIVSTPQEVAVVDAIKAINAFHQLDIPLLGIVENMGGFSPPETNEVYPIFGEGKGKELANRFLTPLLASIPLKIEIRKGGDEGIPYALNQTSTLFSDLAKKIREVTLEPLENPFRN